ncbi:MAG: hypothetical protein Q9172_003045 [Xanthocarpia lactea]
MAPVEEEEEEEIPHRRKPSFPRFIVALFLVKSKPPQCPVQDYLAKLRSYIRTGQHLESTPNDARYIDTLGFWKDSHKRLEDGANEQRARIYALEAELDAYKEAQSHDQSEQDGKKPPPDFAGNARGKKRKRANRTASQPRIDEHKASDLAVSMPAILPDPTRILSHGSAYEQKVNDLIVTFLDPELPDAVYALQKSLSAPSIEPHTTTSIIVFIASTLRSWACNATQTSSPNSTQSKAILRLKIATPPADTAVTAPYERKNECFTPATAFVIFPVIFTTIDKLSSAPNARLHEKQCSYAVIKLLKDILDQICHLASSVGQPSLKPTKPPSKRPRRSARVSGRNPSAPSPTPHEQQNPPIHTAIIPSSPEKQSKHLTHLCAFLIAAIQALHPSNNHPQHSTRNIQEGWMFFLLQRISAVLKSFVFGENDEAWNTACYGNGGGGGSGGGDIPMPLENKDSSSKKTSKDQRAEKERQAPWLILLLEKSMHCFLHQEQQQHAPINKNINVTTYTKNNENSKPNHLPSHLQSQLQDTIFASLFNHDSTLFKAALPEPLDPGLSIEKWAGLESADVVDRFKAEVWRLVGWESLRGYLD